MAIGQQVGRKLRVDGKDRRGFADSMRVWPDGVLFRTFRALSGWLKRAGAAHPTSGGRRMRRERNIVVESGLFDPDWYLETYPDVARAKLDPLDHFLTVGWREGRDPGPLFTTSAYVKAYDDVAGAGTNPLLHFIEFGLAEGRNGFGDRHAPVAMDIPALAELPEANECLSLPRPLTSPNSWVAAEDLDAADPRLLVVGGAKVGYSEDQTARKAVDAMFGTLAWLSGRRDGAAQDAIALSAGASAALADAWFVNNVTLRLRIHNNDGPVVIRTWQTDPGDGDRFKLVGEGLALTDLDFIDLQLANPWFPILIVSASPLGEVRGARLIAFPSLLRGGPHYAELLWHCEKLGRFDATAIDGELLDKLVDILLEKAAPVVANISVDWDAADGNAALFQSDFESWLKLVPGVRISDRPEPPTCRASGGVLTLSPNSIPTVGALVASTRPGQACKGSLLVAHLDPSEPAMLLEADTSAVLGAHWPQLSLAPDEPIPAAIARSVAGRLSEAELLIPISADGMTDPAPRPAITWIIDSNEWGEEALWEAVRSVSLQQGSDKDELLLTGATGASQLKSVATAFAGPAAAKATLEEAVSALATPIVAFIGPGVVLHNDATAGLFASLLDRPGVDTASCVMVSASRKAGVIKTHIVDGAAVVGASGRVANLADATRAAKELWRSAFPVAKPSDLLWSCRTDTLRRWMSAGNAADTAVVHLCSTIVTASTARTATEDPIFRAPRSTKAVQMRWLVG